MSEKTKRPYNLSNICTTRQRKVKKLEENKHKNGTEYQEFRISNRCNDKILKQLVHIRVM